MATFSTASRSPKAGSLAKALLPTLIAKKSSDEQRRDKQTADLLKQARQQKLSQSLLGLEDTSQKGITAWAQQNQVSADEFKELKPILEQREPVEIKDKYGPIQTDTQGREFQVSPEGKREYAPAVKTAPDATTYSEVMTDQYGREYQLSSKGKRAYLPSTSTGQGELNKVAPWYQTMINENTKFYSSGNLEPTRVQQANIDRSNSRSETLVNSIAQKFGISQGQAYPIAAAEIRKERNLTREVEGSFPAANSGFRGNQQETTFMVRDALNRNVPDHILGETLTKKGWTNTQVTEIMGTATNLISPEQAGIDMTKLRKRIPNEGQSVIVDGIRWTRKGKFLINPQGKMVSING